MELFYDTITGTARYLALLPAGATAAAHAPGGQTRPLALRNGIVALVVHHRMQITSHIGDRVRIDRLSPRSASATPAPASLAASSQSTTSAAASLKR